MTIHEQLARFLAEVVLTSHYLTEPATQTELGMTDAEVRCLRLIAGAEPIGMAEVAVRLRVSKPRATQLVALLEANGMVEREVASDRRRIDVATSPKGREAVVTLEARYQRLAEAIEAKLGPEDTATLARLLDQITPLTDLES